MEDIYDIKGLVLIEPIMIFLSLLSILVLVISYIFLIKKNENKNEIVFEEEITDYPIELYLKDEILYLKNNISSVKKKVFFGKIRYILNKKIKKEFDIGIYSMTLKEILNTSLKDKDYIHFIKKAYNLEYSQKELDKEEKRNILNELEELIFNNK